MTIRFGTDYYDLLTFYRYSVKANRALQWRKWMLVVFVPVFIFFNPVVYLFRSPPRILEAEFWWMMAVISAAWIVAVLVAYRNMPARMTRRLMANPENASLWGYGEMTFTDDGITAKDDRSESGVKWHAVVKVRDTGTHILIYVTANAAYIVPKKKIAAQDVATIEALLAAHGLHINKMKKQIT
jgi:hypothetical protein